ncbi:MAG TPA: M56 family metallopeptidase [Bacteroidales bacterium]|nr:M56 family metallopeptidase [Bacteroidales bacterium]HPT01925.1 M56 family metallopeptidase [Bacteroidales bacterium]
MIGVFVYLVKSIIAGALFLGFYNICMRKESFHRFNRYYLLGSAILMAIMPLAGSFLSVRMGGAAGATSLPVINLPEVVISATAIPPDQEKVLLNWTLVGYLVISAAMLAGLVISIIRISRIYRYSRNSETLGENIFVIASQGSPFSFLNRVFIPDSYKNHPGLNAILIHEQAHIRQHHMADLILLEILSGIFWFNPFYFFIKRAMCEVHEYLADREVVRHGTETLSYQQLLYNEVSGNPEYMIAKNFNLLTKKRIIMLIKKSSRNAAIRIGVLLPLIVAAAFFVAITQSSILRAQDIPEPLTSAIQTPPAPPAPPVPPVPPAIQEPQKAEKAKVKSSDKHAKPAKTEQVFTTVEKLPGFPGGDEARVNYMIENVKYPGEARQKGIQGVVFISFIVEKDGSITDAKVLRGIGGGCDEEALRVIKAMPKWNPGTHSGEPVRVQFNMPVKFKLDNRPKTQQ